MKTQMNSQSPETAKSYAQSIPFLYINRRTILGHDVYPYVLLPWSLPGIEAVPMGALLQAWDETPDNFSIRSESGTIFWIYKCNENSDGTWNCLGQSTTGEEIEQTVSDIQRITQTILRFYPNIASRRRVCCWMPTLNIAWRYWKANSTSITWTMKSSIVFADCSLISRKYQVRNNGYLSRYFIFRSTSV